MRLSARKTGWLLLTLGSALLALPAAQEALKNRAPWLPPLFTASATLGALLTVLGLLLLVLPVRTVRRALGRLFEEPQYDFYRAGVADLERVHAYCTQEFGDDVSDLPRMRAWYEVNDSLFWIIEAVRKDSESESRQLVGYFSTIPLTQRAAQLVEKEQLSGATFTVEHIIAQRGRRRVGKAAAVYIGGIAASSWRAKGYVLGRLHAALEAERRRGVAVLYSRPITQRGLDLLLKYQFVYVDPKAHRALKRVYRGESRSRDRA